MNEFERAFEKTQKREQRKTLTLTKAVALEGDTPMPEETRTLTVVKEKRQSIDAVITVAVDLPYDRFELTFTKPNVMGMKRLSRNDFHKAIAEGLRPILGGVK